MGNEFSDAFERILLDHCSPETVRAIEAGASPAGLWTELAQSGFADALVSEGRGGAGLSLADAVAIAELCGRYACPVPMADTMAARGLLCGSDTPIPSGSIAFGSSTGLPGRYRVTNGSTAEWVLAPDGACWRLLAADNAHLRPCAFELESVMGWSADDVASAPSAAVDPAPLLAHALVTSASISGALIAVFDRTLQYANERQQFGKPIGKFQAIQHQLAVMSEHCLAARMAVQIAAPCGSVRYDPLRVAVAKARTSAAAIEVVALAHSIHGAIGFTAEFDLQLLTRRLNSWRRTAGTESFWHDRIGAWALGCDLRSLDLLRQLTDHV